MHTYDRKVNSGRGTQGGMSNSNSYGAVMARGGHSQQTTGSLGMSMMRMANGQQQMHGSGAQNKHQIGFKSDRAPNQTFKSGGPIRATGAALENMDKSDIINSSAT